MSNTERGLDRVLKGEACIICLAYPLPANHDSNTCEMA